MKKSCALVFKAICFFLAGYMAIQLVQRFYNNFDISTITYKPFYSSPTDQYPTFTFCLEDKDYGDSLNYSYLSSKGIEGSVYQKMLKGIDPNLSALSLINFDDVAKSPLEIVCSLETKTRNGTTNILWHDNRPRIGSTGNGKKCSRLAIGARWRTDAELESEGIAFPFYTSYQDPDQVCYTRKTEDGSKLGRKFDRLTLDLKWMMDFSRTDGFQNSILRIYIHGENQFIRNMVRH